jgi:glycosyltransferase involved in cell wall biosynthesis
MSLVTVVIPTRNSGKYFSQCVASLLQQTFRNFDVLVVDASSSDDTRAIAALLPNGRVIEQHGIGLAGAWNQGVRHSTAPHIAFLDSDDWWEPDTLANHLRQLSISQKLDYSIGRLRYIADSSAALPYGFKPSLLEGTHNALMPGCFVGKRALFDLIGPFDETLSVATDIQWFHDLKMSSAQMIELNAHVLNKRVHSNNLSYTSCSSGVYSKELLGVLKRRVRFVTSQKREAQVAAERQENVNE